MAATDKTGWVVRLVLVVSLGLNLLVAGLLVGGAMSRMRDDDRRTHGTEHSLRDIGNLPFVMALGRNDRAALAEALDGRRDALRDNREQLRQRFEAVLTLLRADPFHPERLRAVLADQRATLVERQKLGEDLLISRLAQMSMAERKAYANRLDKSLRRGPRNMPRP